MTTSLKVPKFRHLRRIRTCWLCLKRFRFFLCLFNIAHHKEGKLGQVVYLAVNYLAEALNRLIGGTALTGAPVPIDSPAPLALDGRSMDTPPLCVALSIESRSGDALTVSVSEGVLDSPADSSPRALSSRSAASGEVLTWTVETPDENARYTLSLDGKAAAVLRYDAANGYWAAERP